MTPTKRSPRLLQSPYLWFSLIAICGYIIRLRICHDMSFHTDEGQFIYTTSLHSIFELKYYIRANTSHDQPFLMYLLVYLWKSAFGIAPFILRLLPMFLSSLSVFAAGSLCYFVTKNKFVSLFLAIFVAVAPASIKYSYEVSPYALLSLMSTLSLFLFLKQIQAKNYLPSLILVAVNILFLNSHYYSYFVVCAQMMIFLYFILRAKNYAMLKDFALFAFIFFVSATLPMVLLFDPGLASKAQGWMQFFSQSFIETTVLGTSVIYAATRPYLLSLGAFAIGYWIVHAVRKKVKRDNMIFVIFFYFFTTVVVIRIVERFTWHFMGNHRYMLCIFPTLFLVTLLCVDEIKIKYAKYVVAGLMAVMLAFDSFHALPYVNQDFEGMFKMVKKQEQNKPIVFFFLPGNYNKPLSYYYRDYFQLNALIPLGLGMFYPGNEVYMENYIQDMRRNSIRTAYFVEYYLTEMRGTEEQYLERFAMNFSIGPQKDFKDIRLFELTLKDPDKSKSK